MNRGRPFHGLLRRNTRWPWDKGGTQVSGTGACLMGKGSNPLEVSVYFMSSWRREMGVQRFKPLGDPSHPPAQERKRKHVWLVGQGFGRPGRRWKFGLPFPLHGGGGGGWGGGGGRLLSSGVTHLRAVPSVLPLPPNSSGCTRKGIPRASGHWHGHGFVPFG